MATISLSVNIELETARCSACGCWWAYEKSMAWKGRQCPFCSHDAIRQAQASCNQSERKLRSMKGAFTHQRDRYNALRIQFETLKKNSIPLGKI